MLGLPLRHQRRRCAVSICQQDVRIQSVRGRSVRKNNGVSRVFEYDKYVPREPK